MAQDLARNAVIAEIKRALQKRSGRQWSVTGGRGTAYGWITIDVPPKERTWQHVECPNKLDAYGLPGYAERNEPGERFGHMGPFDRAQLAELLGLENVHYQGHNIPSGHDYYREYIDRANGRTPSACGTPYWD